MKNKTTPTKDTRQMLYWPDEAVALTHDHIMSMQAAGGAWKAGIPLGINQIDEYVAPLLPGQLMTVLGRPQNFKSGMLEWIARHTANWLRKENPDGAFTDVVVFISTENLLEDTVINDLASRSDLDPKDLSNGQVSDLSALARAEADLAGVPIFRVCNAMKAIDRYQPLYLTNVHRVLQLIDSKNINIRGIVLDYLQALPLDPEHRDSGTFQNRRLQVRDDIYRLRDMAAEFSCPVWVGVQTRRGIEIKDNWYLPQMSDAEESGAIEQRSSRMINLWMPKTQVPIGTEVSCPIFKGDSAPKIIVQENSIVIKVTKQQGRLPSGQTFIGSVDFRTGQTTITTSF